jgi:hypothetical protein
MQCPTTVRGAVLVPILYLSACCTGTESCSPDGGEARVAQTEASAPAEPSVSTEAAPEFAEIGARAPGFTLADLEGGSFTLADMRGKTVVLEWFNPECPFVVYAHEDGPLKDMASRWGSDEVVWVAINSGAPGKQGTGAEKNRSYAKKWSMDYPMLLDEDGTVGRRYQAKTTPHVYVVNPAGTLVYRGALDNGPLGRVKGREGLVNYVEDALHSLAADASIKNTDTRPYGCSVKYGRP